MFQLPEWLTAKSRKLSSPPPENGSEESVPQNPDGSSNATTIETSRFSAASNTTRPVIELVRPHLATGICLIVTGYQDFFSSLSIVLREIPDLKDRDDVKIRIAYGVDTSNAPGFSGRGRSVADEARLFYLERHGLCVEDAADLRAVLAADAIKAGKIDLRVFDPEKAREVLGISGDRRLHAKVFVSELGAVAGSANFSRAGLYHNIEYVDEFSEVENARNASASTRAATERKAIAEKSGKPALTGTRRRLRSYSSCCALSQLRTHWPALLLNRKAFSLGVWTGNPTSQVACPFPTRWT